MSMSVVYRFCILCVWFNMSGSVFVLFQSRRCPSLILYSLIKQCVTCNTTFAGVPERELQQAGGVGVPQGKSGRHLLQHLFLLSTSRHRSAHMYSLDVAPSSLALLVQWVHIHIVYVLVSLIIILFVPPPPTCFVCSFAWRTLGVFPLLVMMIFLSFFADFPPAGSKHRSLSNGAKVGAAEWPTGSGYPGLVLCWVSFW